MVLVKKLLSFFKSELGFFLIISIILLAISISPQIKRQLDTPKDRVFSGLEFYSDDYSIYVSNTFQGQRGRWTLLDKHTSEPHQGTIIHDEYLLWGKLMGIFGINAITSYHLFRYAMGFILLIVVYLFLFEIYPDPNNLSAIRYPLSANKTKRMLSFFLIAFSTGFVIVNNSPAGIKFDFHMHWLTELDVFYRFVALPHYLIGNIFFISALICLLRLIKSESYFELKIKNLKLKINKYYLNGSLCSLILALVHPVALVSLLGLLGIYLLFINILKIISTSPLKIINLKLIILSRPNIFFIVSLAVSAPIVLYYKYLMTIPPWNHMAAWEGVTQYFVPLDEFAKAIGPTFYLGMVGIISLFYNTYKNYNRYNNYKTFLLLILWPVSFFLLVYFSYPFLHISQVRFMQVFFFIPFGILAAEGVIFISSLISQILKAGAFRIIAISLLLLFIFLNALPYYYASLEEKYRYFTDFSPLVYPYKDTARGYYYLRDHTDPESVVLAAFLSATQIPYFSNNTVYTGHLWATLNRQAKEVLQNKFLKGEMTNDEAVNFFRNGRISYYFHGWQEAGYGINPNNYPFLKPVYTNPMVTIYKANY